MGDHDDDNHSPGRGKTRAEFWKLGYDDSTGTHFLFGILWFVDLLKQFVKSELSP